MHHPEAGVVDEMFFSGLGKFGADNDCLQIFSYHNGLDNANVDVFVFYFCLAGHDSFAGFEGDQDRWTLLQNSRYSEPTPDHQRCQRDQPDQLRRPARTPGGYSSRDLGQIGLLRVIRHEYSPQGPRSAVDQMTSRRTS